MQRTKWQTSSGPQKRHSIYCYIVVIIFRHKLSSMTAACHSIAKTEQAIQIWQFVYLLTTKTLRDIIVLNYLVTACKHDKRYSMLLSCKCNHIQPNRYYHTTIGHYSMSSNYNLSITNLRWIKIVSRPIPKK